MYLPIFIFGIIWIMLVVNRGKYSIRVALGSIDCKCKLGVHPSSLATCGFFRFGPTTAGSAAQALENLERRTPAAFRAACNSACKVGPV